MFYVSNTLIIDAFSQDFSCRDPSGATLVREVIFTAYIMAMHDLHAIHDGNA